MQEKMKLAKNVAAVFTNNITGWKLTWKRVLVLGFFGCLVCQSVVFWLLGPLVCQLVFDCLACWSFGVWLPMVCRRLVFGSLICGPVSWCLVAWSVCQMVFGCFVCLSVGAWLLGLFVSWCLVVLSVCRLLGRLVFGCLFCWSVGV